MRKHQMFFCDFIVAVNVSSPKFSKKCKQCLTFFFLISDVPTFSDPHIPVVAREILQKMIRQFAVEYTSKASSPQDNCSDPQFCSDQSLPPEPSGAPPSTSPATMLAPSAHDQNPILIKLLMADQDAPLDLTMKKPLAEPSEQGIVNTSMTEELIFSKDFMGPTFWTRLKNGPIEKQLTKFTHTHKRTQIYFLVT